MLKLYSSMQEKNKSSYNHILKYTSIFGGVQGLNILMGLVRNKIVAYLLGPVGMGLVAIFNSTVDFIYKTSNLGISFSAIRNMSEVFDEGKEERIERFVKVVRGWCLLTGLIGVLLCVIAGPLLSNYSFAWGDHTLHFLMLSPAIFLLAVTGGETAILKGSRRLKELAKIQVFTAAAGLILSVPIYFIFGETGIVPVIVLTFLASMLFTVFYSYRFYPLRLRGAKGILGEGMSMVRLGVAYAVAGIIGSGAEMLVRSYLNVTGDLGEVGLYNAGFMLTMTYGGMVFSALESDYFPRLSAIGNDVVKRNEIVNRQSEVTLLVLAPMLATLIVALPLLVPLLFRSDFLPIVGMVQIVLLSFYLRSIYLPMGYITLARGDSWQYLLLESGYFAFMVVMVILNYNWWGLLGTGIALALANVFDIVVTYIYAHIRYKYRFSHNVLRYLVLQLPLGIAVYILTFVDNPFVYWSIGALLCLVSVAISVSILRKKTS